MQNRKYREITEQTMILIAETADKNPALTAEQVGKLCDVSRGSVGKVLRARRVAIEKDADYLATLREPHKNNMEKLVGKWCEVLGLPPVRTEPKTESATRTANVLCQTPEKPSTPPEPRSMQNNNDALYYAKLLHSVQCIPELLNAIQNLSEKLTVLNQRLYTPMNEMSHNLADVADTQQKVVQKLDRVAKSVSVFTDEGGKTPVSVYDAIESGFNDVCGKLDTVRYKLEKAVK